MITLQLEREEQVGSASLLALVLRDRANCFERKRRVWKLEIGSPVVPSVAREQDARPPKDENGGCCEMAVPARAIPSATSYCSSRFLLA